MSTTASSTKVSSATITATETLRRQEKKSKVASTFWNSSSWQPFKITIALTAAFYLQGLCRIPEIYFDEHYYVTVAYQMHSGEFHDPCWADDVTLSPRPLNFEHPPLAKMMIAASIHLLDNENITFLECRDPNGDGKEAYESFLSQLRQRGNPYAWRLPSALFGIATVAVTGMLAGRLFGTPRAAAIGAMVTVADTLLYTSSRLAILDIFPTFFAMHALYTATFADQENQKTALYCAISLGLGFCCKFSAVLAGPPVLLVLLLTRYRSKPSSLTLGYIAMSLFWFALLPNLFLLISYIPWWRLWIPEMGVKGALWHFWRLLKDGLKWTSTAGPRGDELGHPYSLDPIQWLTLSKPMAYYAIFNVNATEGLDRYVYALGNPIVWWGGVAVSLVTCLDFGKQLLVDRLRLCWKTFPTNQQVAGFFPVMVLGGFILLLRRECYLYYMTLVVPYLAVSTTGFIEYLFARQEQKNSPTGVWGGDYSETLAKAYLLLIANAFFHFLPMVAAWDMTFDELLWRRSFIPWMKL